MRLIDAAPPIVHYWFVPNDRSRSESASVILASFKSSHAAERMVASLSHDFRHKARSGKASAFVVTRNRDASYKLVQSRVLTASGIVATAMRLAAAILAGFVGLVSALRGAMGYTHAVRGRHSHVRHDDQRLAELLDPLGPHAALVVIVCTDDVTSQAVVAQGTKRGLDCGCYPRDEFLAFLDRQGDNYDWARPAIVEPEDKSRKHRSRPLRD